MDICFSTSNFQSLLITWNLERLNYFDNIHVCTNEVSLTNIDFFENE